MICKSCGEQFDVKGAKFCPFCGKMLKEFFFTEEQDNFLREHNLMHRKELAEMFNERFGTNKTVSAISHRCRRIGLKLPKDIRYDYTHKKGLPIGTERFYNGIIWVKVKDDNAHHSQSRFKSECWKQKHYLVWEGANGKVPEGHCIIFLDGDSANCELDNLYCCKKTSALMSANPQLFQSEHPQSKKAAVMWCDLYLEVGK